MQKFVEDTDKNLDFINWTIPPKIVYSRHFLNQYLLIVELKLNKNKTDRFAPCRSRALIVLYT